jgi:3-dehydrosphinganine reductase
VWCIAGSSYPKLFIETTTTKMRQQMDVNYWSCVDVAHAILTEWLSPSSSVKGKPKHLIFTSSVVAFYPIVGYTPYGPGKAAIKSLSDTLAQEILLYGENENLTKPGITHILEEPDPVQTPDQAAKAAISGLESGEYLITLGLLGSAMRACAWGGSPRNNWVVDTAFTWITSIAWAFIGKDLDGKVKSYFKKHGHPSTYERKP